jgi:hypothetical protein
LVGACVGTLVGACVVVVVVVVVGARVVVVAPKVGSSQTLYLLGFAAPVLPARFALKYRPLC